MPAKSTKFAFKLTVVDVTAACHLIESLPTGVLAKHAVDRALATPATAKGRYAQRRLAAGREAVIETLFKLYPDQLKGNYHRVTAAFRAGTAPVEPDWTLFNELGAQALGLPIRH